MFKKVLVTLCVLLLCACTAKKVNHENYQKIHNEMNMADVTKILGKPTEEKALTIAGLSATAASWQDGNDTILITFINGRVTSKNFTKTKSK